MPYATLRGKNRDAETSTGHMHEKQTGHIHELTSRIAARDAKVAILGLGTVGIYSPAPTMSPVRWGPRSTTGKVLVPDLCCPARRNCLQGRCEYYNCLEQVQVQEVVRAAEAALRPGDDRQAQERDSRK